VTNRFVCWSLWIVAILVLSAGPGMAGVDIQFSSPMVVDSTVDAVPAVDMTSPICTHIVGLCEGPDFNLLLMAVSRTTMFVRIDKQGDLIDTLPRVYRDLELSLGYFNTFRYVASAWCQPYFYIFETRQDSLFYTRMDEQLNQVDAAPVMLLSPDDFEGKLVIDGCDVWLVDRGGSNGIKPIVTLIQLPSLEPVFEKLVVPVDVWSSWDWAASDGLYLTIRNDVDSVFMARHVSREGTVEILPTTSYAYLDTVRFRHDSMIPFGADSVLYKLFDVRSDTNIVLYYTVLSLKDRSDTVELKRLVLPNMSTDNAYFPAHGGMIDGPYLLIPGRYNSGAENSAYLIQVDLTTSTVAANGPITGELDGPYLPDLQMTSDANSMYFFFSYYCNASRLTLAKSDPLVASSVEPIYYTSTNYRTPTICLDSSGLLMCVQRLDSLGESFQAYRFVDPMNLQANTAITVSGGEGVAYRPWLYDLGEFNGLVWLDVIPDFETSPYFVQKFTAFSGDVADLDTYVKLADVPRTLWNRQRHKSDIWLQDSFAILNAPIMVGGNDYGSGTYNWLHRLGIPNWQDHSVLYGYPSGGSPALCDYGDSAVIVASDVWVTGYNHHGFPDSYDGDYKGYVVKDAQPVKEMGLDPVGSIDWCPLDVFPAVLGQEQVLSLSCVDELVTFTEAGGSFQPLFDLAPYTHGGYIDAGGFDRGSLKPIETNDYYVVVLQGGHLQHVKLLVFDKTFNYVDSARVHFEGIFNELSEVVYLPDDDALVFAYSAWLPHPFGAHRVIIQSARFMGPTSVEDQPERVPEHFLTCSNYPNPFNASTTIEFSLSHQASVVITIRNILGQKVVDLVNGVRQAGSHQVSWEGIDSKGRPVSSGVYFYQIKAAGYLQTHKMMLLK